MWEKVDATYRRMYRAKIQGINGQDQTGSISAVNYIPSDGDAVDYDIEGMDAILEQPSWQQPRTSKTSSPIHFLQTTSTWQATMRQAELPSLTLPLVPSRISNPFPTGPVCFLRATETCVRLSVSA